MVTNGRPPSARVSVFARAVRVSVMASPVKRPNRGGDNLMAAVLKHRADERVKLNREINGKAHPWPGSLNQWTF
jgi:hypothetical protein